MAEENGSNEGNGNGSDKREIEYHAPVREFDNKINLVTNVGFTAKSDEKFQILWLIPSTDEESKERYDCSLAVLIQAGVRQFSTRPNYKDAGFFCDPDKESYGDLKENGHQAMQDTADGYKVGARVVGVSQKVLADKAKIAEDKTGMSIEEMQAKILEMKEAGLLDD
jgi:hypothetical protein